ncbi:WD40/YVTN/BNR-like repeat-containing protein [Streptomyces sp. NPDC088350]|uniref:WD40/YVTN/BNR-like repeat-containing protein n=1 Tax=Streptomyces sp. NPDC088350 TaxID=3365854 RepID=UPI0038106795
MTSTPSRKAPAAGATKIERRRVAAAEKAAAARRAEQRARRLRWGGTALAVSVVAAGGIFFATRGGSGGSSSGSASRPFVGGDLHTVSVVGSRLFVGGHEAAAASGNGGRTWREVPSLRGADPMGWARTPGSVLVGGHPGLYRSTDGGATFTKVTGAGAVSDVHGIGASGNTAYIASPVSGLLASSDGGKSWRTVNAQAGRSVMGTILVDPKDPQRLIAPDMASGLQTSSDGGKTWKSLGGPLGVMTVAWNPKDINQIVAVGMNGAELSTDGGKTWKQVDLSKGASAIGYDATGSTLYAGVLDDQNARTDRSTDGATTWKATA